MFKERYEVKLPEFLSDKTICKENRALFKTFFEKQERKLKQRNGLMALDEATYKTLLGYMSKFRNVNTWFHNKPLKKISKSEFERVFNDLCDGKILNEDGQPFASVDDYVNKIFRSKLFKLAGKSQIVEEVTEFYQSPKKEKAEYIVEADVVRLIEHAANADYKLLFQLAFDIGENVSSMLQLKKKNCRRVFNEVTKDHEYHIVFNPSILKRSRTARTEPTRFKKTVELLDYALKDLDDEDFIFHRSDNMARTAQTSGRVPFSLRSAEITFDRLVKKLDIKMAPENNVPSLKHLRSSMACDCLMKGWSTEEVNGRLGHSINSRALKPYVTLLCLNKGKPKVREYRENIAGLNDALREQKELNTLLQKRQEDVNRRLNEIAEQVEKNRADMKKETRPYSLDEVRKIVKERRMTKEQLYALFYN